MNVANVALLVASGRSDSWGVDDVAADESSVETIVVAEAAFGTDRVAIEELCML